jgi:hypothetical protein
MRRVLHAKFTGNPELREKLLATGAAYLVENCPHKQDGLWADNGDGTGQNRLAALLGSRTFHTHPFQTKKIPMWHPHFFMLPDAAGAANVHFRAETLKKMDGRCLECLVASRDMMCCEICGARYCSHACMRPTWQRLHKAWHVVHGLVRLTTTLPTGLTCFLDGTFWPVLGGAIVAQALSRRDLMFVRAGARSDFRPWLFNLCATSKADVSKLAFRQGRAVRLRWTLPPVHKLRAWFKRVGMWAASDKPAGAAVDSYVGCLMLRQRVRRVSTVDVHWPPTVREVMELGFVALRPCPRVAQGLGSPVFCPFGMYVLMPLNGVYFWGLTSFGPQVGTLQQWAVYYACVCASWVGDRASQLRSLTEALETDTIRHAASVLLATRQFQVFVNDETVPFVSFPVGHLLDPK